MSDYGLSAAQSQVGGVQPRRMGQVSEQGDRLSRAAKETHEQLSRLEERISLIVRPDGPATIDSQKKENRTLVTHAEALSSVAEIVEATNIRIADLIARIEL